MRTIQPTKSLTRTRICLPAVIAVLLTVFSPRITAASVQVRAIADIALAGQASGVKVGSDTAPLNSPVEAGLTLVAGKAVQVESVTGSVSAYYSRNVPADGDAGSIYDTATAFGLSPVRGPIGALIGVFLDATTPSGQSPPARLDFSSLAARDVLVLSPALRQVFYIGQGKTTMGVTKRFVVPSGATRLFLGVLDVAGDNSDNTGSFQVTLTLPNSRPSLPPIANRTINELTSLTFTANATDSEVPGQTLTYSLDAGAPGGASINSTTGAFTWTPTEAQGPSTNVVTVAVIDNGSPPLSASQTFTVVVNEVAAAPVLESIANQTVNEGSTLTVKATASDGDIPPNTLTFALGPGAPDGASIDPASGLLSWTPSEGQGPGTNVVTVTVTDNASPPLSASQTFTVVINEVNSSPVLMPILDQQVVEGSRLTFPVTANDADLPFNALTFQLGAGAPPGATIHPATGLFTWVIPEQLTPTTNVISLVVNDDGVPSLSVTNQFAVVIEKSNSAPVLPVVADQTVDEATALSLKITANDADLPPDTLTFTLEPEAPEGATIDPDTGGFAWVPGEAFGGTTTTITVRVTDNGLGELSATRSFSVTINEVNAAPEVTLIPDQQAVEGSTLTVPVLASDSDLPANALTFQLGPGAPEGASIAPTTGLFTWPIPEQLTPATNVITVIVSDDGEPSLSATNQFAVAIDKTNSPPVLPAVADQIVDEATTFSLNIASTDSDLPPDTLTFALEPGAPEGAALEPATGLFTWTPPEAPEGSTNLITVKVTDSGIPSLSATNSFLIVARKANANPTIEAIADQTVDEKSPVFLTVKAADSDQPAQALTYSLESGVPDGATVNAATGAFFWRPTEAQGPGTYAIGVRATDDGTPPMSATVSFTVTVREVNQAPVLGSIPTQTVTVGQLMSVTVTATDPDIPANKLTYGLGSTPAGVAIDPVTGLLTWRPGAEHASTTNAIPVTVIDDGVPTLSATLTLRVIVNPAAEVRLAVQMLPGGALQLTLSGDPGRTYFIETSEDFEEWSVLTNVVGTSMPLEVIDAAAVGLSKRFYRAFSP